MVEYGHSHSAFGYEPQSEAQTCDCEQQQPRHYPPAKAHVQVVHQPPDAFLPLHRQALPPLLLVFWQTDAYSADEDYCKKQCSVGDNQFAWLAHHQSGVELGDVGKEVALGGCAVRTGIVGLAVSTRVPLRSTVGICAVCAIRFAGGVMGVVRCNHTRHAEGVAYLVFEHERGPREADERDEDAQWQRQPQVNLV